MRVQFLTNASCPEGLFGEGATADLSDAQALAFERQGAVKLLEEAGETVTSTADRAQELQIPAENPNPTPDVSQAGPTSPEPSAAPQPVQNVQVSAGDTVGVETHQG